MRRYVALSLCALLLASTTSPLSAQKRVAIRVPAGEATTPAPVSRKSESERERARPRHARTRAAAQDRRLTSGGLGSVNQDGPTVGVPTTGEIGVQKMTSELMREQANAPAVARGVRLAPEHEIEGRDERPQDPDAQPVASFSAAAVRAAAPARGGRTLAPTAAETAPLAPQTLGLNFDTVTGPTETGAFPPDTMGAIGPTQFFVFLNGRLRTFDKTTGAADGVVNVDSDVFFASVMTPVSGGTLNVNFTSDPQIRYDRLSGRWILIMIDVPSTNAIGDTANRILIAVSDAASNGTVSGSTVWTYYFVQQDTVGAIPSTGQFLDYPSLGIDANALYIGGDMYVASSSTFQNTNAYVIRKSSVLSGGPVVTTAFRNLIGTDGPLEPRGVDNYDPAATEGYFIGVSFAAFSRLNMRRIATPGGTPTISADIPITTPLTTTSAIAVNHLGNTGGTNGRVDGIDDRLYAAHIRNGRLWTAHSFTTLSTGVASTNATNRRMSVRWYEIIVPPGSGTPTFNQSGTVFDNVNTTQAAARQYFIPSIMVSGQGHAALGYSTGGTPFRLDAATNGRLTGDTLGTTGAVNIYTASTTAYNPPGDPGPPRRWGDYSFTTLDPLDDMTMWTIQEYCNGANTYGTRVVKLNAPPPATPTSASPLNVPQNTPSQNVVVTGTVVSGSGFYDPGANLAPPALPFNHISASVTGGVTVNSTTYNSPTQVTLNVSTVGASPGPQTITVTNPDGQSLSGTATITVTAPLVPPATAGQVIISEFRFHGPLSTSDEFVELYNTTNNALDISGFTLYALTAAGAQSLRFTVPGALASNTTVIPAHGHYLMTGAGYTLPTTSNGALSTDIVDGSGVALFAGATPTAPTRIDSAGFDNRDALFFEGSPITPSGAGTGGITVGGEYSFVRKLTSGAPQDTGNNDNDFAFVSTNGAVYSTRLSTLGAPSPENLTSPVNRFFQIQTLMLDPSLPESSAPNRVRNAASYTDLATPSSVTGVAPGSSPYVLGTLSIRRRFVNNTGVPITQLRLRVVDVTTFPSPGVGTADIRVLSSPADIVVSVNNAGTCSPNPAPCNLTVKRTVLEQPPTQAMGGGLNSAVNAFDVSSGTPLANGASIDLQILLGVAQGGSFRFFITIEALP